MSSKKVKGNSERSPSHRGKRFREVIYEQQRRQKSESTTHAFTDHRSTIFSLFDDSVFLVDTLSWL